MLTNRLSASRRIFITVMRVLLVLAAVLTAALVVFMIVYVLSKGLPYVTWHLLSTKPSYVSGTIGILPDICNTVQILLASLLIVLPLGVGAAVYLTEYAQNKKLVAAIEYAAETLSGIPSIIYGLVGMLFFCEFLGMQTSLLAGALTLVIMNLPTVLRTTQESLRTVPQSYREGAFGLGAGKWRVVRTVVLPGCIDGIVTGCILSAGRILGESAALLFTAGFAHSRPGSSAGRSRNGARHEGSQSLRPEAGRAHQRPVLLRQVLSERLDADPVQLRDRDRPAADGPSLDAHGRLHRLRRAGHDRSHARVCRALEAGRRAV